jgi:nucleoside-diphosphate-sugar epimerase
MADDLMQAHRRGELQVTALRSSDYYGPGVFGSALGDMVFGNLVSGKKAQLSGSADMPHSWAYIEDVGRAVAILGTRDQALGEVWIAPHAPPKTQGQVVQIAAQSPGIQPQFSVLSPFMMRLGGLFNSNAREMVEMMYEFTQPFVVDSTRFEQAFQVQPTPIEDGIAKTVAWYRANQE